MSTQDELDNLGRAAVGIAAVRVWCGLWLLLLAWSQFPAGGSEGWALPERIASCATHLTRSDPPEGARPLLAFVKAHPTWFGWLTLAFAIGAGSLLVVGLGTRTAAGAVALVHAGAWVAAPRSGAAHAGLAMTMTVASLCVILGDGGRYYGLDGLLRRPRGTRGSPG